MHGVLTTASRVTCGHEPSKVEKTCDAKLKVGGHSVLLRRDIEAASITMCNTPSSSGPKCKTVLAVSAGESNKLMVGGKAVMLDTLAGKPSGVPTPGLSAKANQTKLQAL